MFIFPPKGRQRERAWGEGISVMIKYFTYIKETAGLSAAKGEKGGIGGERGKCWGNRENREKKPCFPGKRGKGGKRPEGVCREKGAGKRDEEKRIK